MGKIKTDGSSNSKKVAKSEKEERLYSQLIAFIDFLCYNFTNT